MSIYIEHENKEIGSYFSIDPNQIGGKVTGVNCFFEKRYELYSTCRSAIQSILLNIEVKNKLALLPAFTCHAVVEPFRKSGFKVYPYQINRDFTINVESLKKIVEEKKPSIILIHDYFGFDSNVMLKESGIIEEYQGKGIVIIEDLTQSMFSGYRHISSDYQVGSIRKWMGVPDGAFIQGPGIIKPDEPDIALEEAKRKAMFYKHEYLSNQIGDKNELLALYRGAENILDSQDKAYAISELSLKLLNTYDITGFCSLRKDNARKLLELFSTIEGIVLPFKKVETNETPFYIPAMVKRERKALQQFLAQNGVFATVIWGCPEEFVDLINKDTQSIYDEILCVPCDQRYTINDMKFIGELLADFTQK